MQKSTLPILRQCALKIDRMIPLHVYLLNHFSLNGRYEQIMQFCKLSFKRIIIHTSISIYLVSLNISIQKFLLSILLEK